MILAVDSLPLSDDVYFSLDYSGLQVHGLSHLPLHRAAKRIEGDGLHWQVVLKPVTWNDGQPIHPKEYIEGLAKLVAVQPMMSSFLKQCLKRIAIVNGNLTIEFSERVGREFFNWPNWVPFREGHISGDFSLNQCQDGWKFTNRYGQNGKIHLVKSPEENELLFQEGRLDVSADTAIQLHAIDASVQRRDTGLMGFLVYGRHSSPKLIHSLNLALRGLQFSKEIEAAFPSIRENADPKPSAPQNLRLAYDPFYPNHEVTEQIATHLSPAGWKVELIEDDYYQPKNPGDVKFMILRPPVLEPKLLSYWMRRMPRASLKSSEGQLARGLNWLKDAEVAYPLFKIPSFYKSRLNVPNPLLEVFA